MKDEFKGWQWHRLSFDVRINPDRIGAFAEAIQEWFLSARWVAAVGVPRVEIDQTIVENFNRWAAFSDDELSALRQSLTDWVAERQLISDDDARGVLAEIDDEERRRL